MISFYSLCTVLIFFSFRLIELDANLVDQWKNPIWDINPTSFILQSQILYAPKHRKILYM